MWVDSSMATAAYRYQQGIFIKRSPNLLMLCILSILFVVTILPFQQTARAEDEGAYGFVAKWGPPDLTRDGNVQYPEGIAVDAAGTRVYVADTGNHRIQKYTPTGSLVSKWGSQGSGSGQFKSPGGIAVDAAGNVYVADSGNHRIQKFTSSGDFISTWGSQGAGDGQFSYPGGVAVDTAGNAYVVDTANHRIQKFTASGVFIAKWGSQGSGNGQFSWPSGIAVDAAGNVYVVDTYNSRIQKFSSSGTYITRWGEYGRWVPREGQFQLPRGIAIDTAGYVYVTEHNDRDASSIQKFSTSGTYLAEWYGEGDAHMQGPYGIAIDTAGNVYVADQRASVIQKYTTSGGPRARWGNQITEGLGRPVGIATDSAGNVYVHDGYHFGIDKFSSSGSFIARWGSWGLGDGLGEGHFYIPSGVAVDGRGFVYAVDSWNDTVQRFSSAGTFAGQWGSLGSANDQFDYPVDIAADADGNVYVVDSQNVCIKKFTSAGTFVTKWGSRGTGDGQFDYAPDAIAVDSSGNVYVGEGSRIQKFSSSGAFIGKWGSYGSGDGLLACVSGIAVDASGYVYVTDSCNQRVQKFSPSGTFITKWGARGSGDGFFTQYGPNKIAVDAAGNVYVIDIAAWTVQKFAPSTATAAANPLYFPHVATTGGWQTEVAVINTSNGQSVNGTLKGYSNQGQLVETLPVALSALGRREVTVANEFANHSGIGYIVYESDSSSVQGYTRLSGSAGAYRAAFPAAKEVNAGDIYVPHIDVTAYWRTVISLLNTTSSTKTLTLAFNNYETRQIILAAHEHRTFDIAQDFFYGQPQSGIKSAVIRDANGIVGLEMFGNTNNQQLDGILLTGKTAQTLYYPHVDTNGWWTGIVAYNPSDSESTITIRPYDKYGTSLSPVIVTIGARYNYVRAIPSQLNLPADTAWFKIVSTQPLSGFELFGTTDGNLLGPYAGNGSAGSRSGIFGKIEKSGWTGIAFVNTEDDAAAVTLTAYDNNGSAVATTVLSVGGRAREVRFAEAFFSQDVGSATYIAFTSDRNVVGFQLNSSMDGMMLDGLPALGGTN